MAIESIDLPRKVKRIFPKYLEGCRQNGIWNRTILIYPQHLLAVTEEEPFRYARWAFQWADPDTKRDKDAAKFHNNAIARLFKTDQGFIFGQLALFGEPTIGQPGTFHHSDHLFLTYNWPGANPNFTGATIWGEIAGLQINIEYDSKGTQIRSKIYQRTNNFVTTILAISPKIDPQEILEQLFHPDTLDNPVSAPPDLDYSWRSADILRIVGIRRISLARRPLAAH